MRVDTREFKQIEKRTDPIIEQGKKDHAEYVKNAQSPTADDSEMFVRNTLEDVMKEIQQWFIDYYDFVESDFDNFPSLDTLIWHKDGWSIHSALANIYEEYNRIRDKSLIILRVNIIIDTESIRLRNTIFDTANERTQRFNRVTITGENRCGGCGFFYGTFRVEKVIIYYHLIIRSVAVMQYITIKTCGIGAVVAHLAYIQQVGSSNLSFRTSAIIRTVENEVSTVGIPRERRSINR